MGYFRGDLFRFFPKNSVFQKFYSISTIIRVPLKVFSLITTFTFNSTFSGEQPRGPQWQDLSSLPPRLGKVCETFLLLGQVRQTFLLPSFLKKSLTICCFRPNSELLGLIQICIVTFRYLVGASLNPQKVLSIDHPQ